MPSGEVFFTSPIEDSVEGVVHFDFPSVYSGHDVRAITLTVEKGQVMKWEAEEGQQVLDQVFAIEGSRYFGEVAMGLTTGYSVRQGISSLMKKSGAVSIWP